MEIRPQEKGVRDKNLGIEIELTKMEKLSSSPVIPPQALTACGEDGVTTIVRWWKTGPLVNP